jgi:hypothetical protein
MNNSKSKTQIPSLGAKPVVAAFDGGDITSDAGWLLVALADRQIGLTAAIAQGIVDSRDPAKVEHRLEELFKERIYAIASGYEDCNDLDFLRKDPALKEACGRNAITGADLASQPTLSRVENMLTQQDLLRMAKEILFRAIAQIPKGSRVIILDVDATDDPTHGSQQLTLFNGHYDEHCYVPLHVFATGSDGKRRIVASVLRPGNASYKTGLIGTLRAVTKALRERFPKARIILRADSDFGKPLVLSFCREHRLDYVLGLAGNSVLLDNGLSTMLRTAVNKTVLGGDPVEYDEFSYKAGSWPLPERVIIKCEVTQEKLNPRFVVNNLSEAPRELYELYCARGECENGIKELKLDLNSGRTSCSRFLANQARLLLHTAAMVLMQVIQDAAVGTRYAAMQAGTLRVRLLKVGARVVESVRRVCFHLSSSHPDQQGWSLIAQRLLVG